jgi:hypothetical protein
MKTSKIAEYIKKGILSKFEKAGSKLIWVSKKQVLKIPNPYQFLHPKMFLELSK